MAEPDVVCAHCSKPIVGGNGVALPDDRRVHVRCLARHAMVRSVEVGAQSREVMERSEQLQARSQHLLEKLARRLPCPLCGESLASPDAVLFEANRLVHARCWPGDAAPTRICAKCSTPLEKYEPAAFEGRTVYHIRCWAGSKEGDGFATSG